ncbi:hypothetical protein Efla_007267 [Eimeria flavescens]
MFSLFINNKHGSLVFQKNFREGQNVSANDAIRQASTFHGLCEIAAQLSPVSQPEIGELSFIQPRGIVSIEAPTFRVQCLETLTGLRFVLVCEPQVSVQSAEGHLRRVYSAYSDFALKNPFYDVDMPLRWAAAADNSTKKQQQQEQQQQQQQQPQRRQQQQQEDGFVGRRGCCVFGVDLWRAFLRLLRFDFLVGGRHFQHASSSKAASSRSLLPCCCNLSAAAGVSVRQTETQQQTPLLHAVADPAAKGQRAIRSHHGGPLGRRVSRGGPHPVSREWGAPLFQGPLPAKFIRS